VVSARVVPDVLHERHAPGQFLGISVSASPPGRDNYLTWTPALLVLALAVAQFIKWKA
jgi:hypothetical protein